MNGSTSDGYGDSWVQEQLGTVTDGYRCDSWVQGQSGTEVGDSRVQDQSGTGVCDSWVQGQSGTSGATIGYSDNLVQVMRQSGTATTEREREMGGGRGRSYGAKPRRNASLK